MKRSLSEAKGDIDRPTFEYLLAHDVAGLMENLCLHLMENQPDDPQLSLVQHLIGLRSGNFHGGVAVAGQYPHPQTVTKVVAIHGTESGGAPAAQPSSKKGEKSSPPPPVQSQVVSHVIPVGWIMIYDAQGKLKGSIERLPMTIQSELQCIVSCPGESCLFVSCHGGGGQQQQQGEGDEDVEGAPGTAAAAAILPPSLSTSPRKKEDSTTSTVVVPEKGKGPTTSSNPTTARRSVLKAGSGGPLSSSGADSSGAENSENLHNSNNADTNNKNGTATTTTILRRNSAVKKYSFSGELIATYDFEEKEIGCMSCDRLRKHLWVCFTASSGGGGVVLSCSTGARIRTFQLPALLALHFPTTRSSNGGMFLEEGFWALSGRSVEKRNIETLQLELTSHVPDSMMSPSAFAVTRRHIWCAAASSEGGVAFVGLFDHLGRMVQSVIAPSAAVIAADRQRSGTWHMPRTSTTGNLVFVNERGNRVISQELGRMRKVCLVTDHTNGFLWLFRQTDAGENRLGVVDPLVVGYMNDHALPDIISGGLPWLVAL